MSYSKLSKVKKEAVDKKIGIGSKHSKGKQLVKRVADGGVYSWLYIKKNKPAPKTGGYKWVKYTEEKAREEEAAKIQSSEPTPAATKKNPAKKAPDSE